MRQGHYFVKTLMSTAVYASDIFVKAGVLQEVLGSVQCGRQILGHGRHLVLKGLLKLGLAGHCPTRPASMRLRDHRLGR